MTLEERVALLEREMADLKRQLAADKGNWIEAISGTFRDVPEFDEVLRLGREIRQADRPDDDSGPEA
ncbi:MAG: hypothetical protein ACREJB_01400 [Planctomycetaceae bacterium]